MLETEKLASSSKSSNLAIKSNTKQYFKNTNLTNDSTNTSDGIYFDKCGQIKKKKKTFFFILIPIFMKFSLCSQPNTHGMIATKFAAIWQQVNKYMYM